MKITVTGLESSGTRWMCGLLALHPGVKEVVHTSIPENRAPETRFPDLSGTVVWMLRDETCRARSVAGLGYEEGRDPHYLGAAVTDWAAAQARFCCPFFVSYEGLVGPLGLEVLRDVLRRLGLNPAEFPEEFFEPEDGNLKYMGGART